MSENTELADAARTCPVMHHAHLIAGWVGDGRTTGEDGLPVRADLPELARTLDISVPAPSRDAVDVPEVYRAWLAALSMDLISFDADGKVRTGAGVVEWATLDEDELLRQWSQALVSVVSGTLGIEDLSDAIELCEIALDGMDTLEGPSAREPSRKAIEDSIQEQYVDLGEESEEPEEEAAETRRLARDSSATLLTEFLAFGAVLALDEGLRITELGTWAVDELDALLGSETGAFDAINELLAEDGIDPADTAAVQQWLEEFAETFAADTDSSPDDDVEYFGSVDLRETFELPENLPPVSLPTESELAEAARASELLARARELAVWIGDGTPVDSDGELERRHALDFARRFETDPVGVEVEPEAVEPEAGSGMAGLAELAQLWYTAVRLDWIDVDPEQATATRTTEAQNWPDGDDETVLEIWSRALYCLLTDSVLIDTELSRADPSSASEDDEDDLDFAGIEAALAVMLFLGRRSGVPLEELDELIEESACAALEADEAEQAWNSWLTGHGSPMRAVLARLARLGAVELDAESARLTALGTYAVRNRMLGSGITVPVLPPVESMDVTELIAAVSEGDEDELVSVSQAWLSVRDPATGAAELLGAAERGTPMERIIATGIVGAMEPAQPDRWRAVLDTPGLRAYAKTALAQISGTEPGERGDLEHDEADFAWLLTDTVAATAAPGDEEELATELGELTIPAEQVYGLFEQIRCSGHPYAHQVLSLIGQHHPDTDTAKAARKAAFRAASSN